MINQTSLHNPTSYFKNEIYSANEIARLKGIDVDNLTQHQELAAMFAFDWQSDMNDYERTEFLNSCPFTNKNVYEYRIYSTPHISRSGVTFSDNQVSVLINSSHNEKATKDLSLHVYTVLCELTTKELQALCFG
ncbi:hypothetical protein [Photobacterium leiognathi]|uniref:hypothetical protein n=1 Tax=Photobacterium leiognathi TaxID=553611 RepID=UPI0029829D9C|nr:hypothetical protein [Photobacterium leiognathi]